MPCREAARAPRLPSVWLQQRRPLRSPCGRCWSRTAVRTLVRQAEDRRSRPVTQQCRDARATENAGLNTSDHERPPVRQSRDHRAVGCQVRLADRRVGRALARTGVSGQPRCCGDRGACRVEGAEAGQQTRLQGRQRERSRHERRGQTRASPRTEESRRARRHGCIAREMRKPNRATRTAAGALLLFSAA
jgi:hypothetical protein